MKKVSTLFSLFVVSIFTYSQTNVWNAKANFGGVQRYGVSGFSIGTKGYMGMGYDGSLNYNDLWEWDQGTNVWTQKANLPGALRRTASSFSILGKGYICCGYNGTHLKDLWRSEERRVGKECRL